ncbi:MAG TPA: hypothetical protein GX396_01135 [Tissierellia bacterium]|jgi:hypothetical protein|nr:hypothetical protein [Tissierellia bacterium]
MVEPLLEIKTTPISYELKINRAKYEIDQTNPSFKLIRDRGGLKIAKKPTRLNIDTVEARYSAGIKSAMRSVEDYSKKGIKAAYEATANYAKEGNYMLKNFTENPLPEIAMRRIFSNLNFNLSFVPKVGPDISWDIGDTSINFEKDKLNYDWNIEKPKMNYIPWSIEMIIKEYPKIEITYKGTPIFVPPSADPNYKEIDTLV